MALDDILLEAEEKMIKTEEVVQHEFSGVRTGKASASLVENILVEAYGSQMRIRELAGITAPEPRMLLIQPWDAGTESTVTRWWRARERWPRPRGRPVGRTRACCRRWFRSPRSARRWPRARSGT